jgi:uncharacterized protein YhbP (UPF0306 family)
LNDIVTGGPSYLSSGRCAFGFPRATTARENVAKFVAMTKAELVAFIGKQRHGVQASVAAAGQPQAAVVGIAVTDAAELIFDTLSSTRKCANLRRDPRIAFVITDDERTVQYEGLADEPTGAELDRCKAIYFRKFPDGPTRLAWPGITYFRVRPTWIRFSDFSGPEALIVEVAV